MTRALWAYFAVVAVGHLLALAAATGRISLFGTPAADWARLLNTELAVVALCSWLDPVLAWHDRRTQCDGIYRDCDGQHVANTADACRDVSKILTTGKPGGVR